MGITYERNQAEYSFSKMNEDFTAELNSSSEKLVEQLKMMLLWLAFSILQSFLILSIHFFFQDIHGKRAIIDIIFPPFSAKETKLWVL